MDFLANNRYIINAGIDKEIIFPVKDITLFAQVSDLIYNDYNFNWSQISGPSGATFSAYWSATTTVTFTQIGTYVFRLTANKGIEYFTGDTTITVSPANSQTSFYVDPSYIGGSNDGSSVRPWTTLALSSGSFEWGVINTALNSNNVIIYFSARNAGSDTPEVETSSINLWRLDTSNHKLVLDGMSKYNTNDSIGSWLDYTGSNKFKVAITSGALSIGVQSTNSLFPMNYTTIRGFDLSGASGRALIAGNYTVFEYNYVHDVTVMGATVQFQSAVRDYPNCTALFGNLRDITFRSNIIERGFGESLYIAGTYTRQGDGGCLAWGNTHSDILIEGNIIRNAGTNGGEPDGIDLKAGLLNITVRNNIISDRPVNTKAITALGIFSGIGNYLIENNVFLNNLGSAIVLQKQNGATIRNNLSNIGGGISTSGDANITFWLNKQVLIYNNTIYGNTFGIALLNADGILIKNNLIFNNGSGKAIQGNSTAINVLEDYNVYDIGTSQVTNGGHSHLISSFVGLVVDASGGDFHLPSGSIAIGNGIPLNFPIDIDKTIRTIPWDVGSYVKN